MIYLWHSKADKIVNNFHGQSRFQFHGQTPIFMVKTLIFVVKTCSDLQIFLITKYLGHKISWSISIPFQCQNFMLSPIPFQFYAQFRSIPTAFHGQSRIHDQWQCTRISHAFLLTLIRTTLDPTSSVKYCNCSQWTLKLTPMVSSKAWLTSGAGRSRLSLTMKSWLNGTELSIKLELDRVEYEIWHWWRLTKRPRYFRSEH